MEHEFPQPFAQQYDMLLKHMTLCGLRIKTVELHSHGARRAAGYFGFEMDNLSREQLTEYLSFIPGNSSPWQNAQKKSLKRTTQFLAVANLSI